MLVWLSGLLWNALSALAFLFLVVSVRRHQCGFHVICTSWSTLIALFSHWAVSGGAGRDVHPTGSSAVGFGVVACSNELSSVKNRLLAWLVCVGAWGRGSSSPGGGGRRFR